MPSVSAEAGGAAILYQQATVPLQDEKIHHIYSSPFLRTVQTAHEVAEIIHVPVKIEYGLSEGLFTSKSPCPLDAISTC